MDAGLAVNNTGLIAALFALMACIALSVELGIRPAPVKQLDSKDEGGKGKETKFSGKEKEGKRSKGVARKQTKDGLSTSTSEEVEVPIDPTISLSDNGSSPEMSLEEQGRRRVLESVRKIVELQRKFVDGFLGPRTKYDVAIAMLNEFQNTGVSEKDQGETMATQAYLSATRNLTLSRRERADLLKQKKAEPPAKPAGEPSAQSEAPAQTLEPSNKPANPVGLPVNSTGQAANPFSQPVNPPEQTANPFTQPVNSPGQAANPFSRAVNPPGQAVNPSNIPSIPFGQAAKPTGQGANDPLRQPPKPSWQTELFEEADE